MHSLQISKAKCLALTIGSNSCGCTKITSVHRRCEDRSAGNGVICNLPYNGVIGEAAKGPVGNWSCSLSPRPRVSVQLTVRPVDEMAAPHLAAQLAALYVACRTGWLERGR